MARSFSGGTNAIRPTFFDPTNAGNSDYSISAWVKTDASNNPFVFISWGDLGSGSNLTFYNDGSTGGFTASQEGRGSIASGNGALTASTWYHLGFTYQGSVSGKWILYQNGVAGNTLTTFQVTPSPSNLYVGRRSDGVNNGVLADVCVWYQALLTASEMAALARGARPSQIRPKSIKAWWPLDGLQSPEPDLSGNANNGTVTGTALAFGPPFMPFTRRMPQFNFVSVVPSITLMPQCVT